MKSSLSFAKVWFVLSLTALAFVYGAGVVAYQLFPFSFLNRAMDQARVVLNSDSRSPGFLEPKRYDRSGAQAFKPEKIQPGLTLVSSNWKDSSGWHPKVKLIDRKGRTLHEWIVNIEKFFPDSLMVPEGMGLNYIHGTHLFRNGDLLANLEDAGTVRLSACGDLLWRLKARAHHSIDRAEDGTFWIPDIGDLQRPRSELYPNGYPGLDVQARPRIILHVGQEGNVLREIKILDILYSNGLERYISKAYKPPVDQPPRVKDITHLNDIEPLKSSLAEEYPGFEAGDLLVSLKRLNLVFVFDPDTYEVRWHTTGPFIAQHDPDFIGNGWIGLFDNNTGFMDRGEMLGGSRIVALQPHTDSTKVLFPTQYSDRFYTPYGGKWQKLENDNLLLSEAYPGRVLEVTPDGRTVWEWVKKAHGSKVPHVLGATRYNLSLDEVASWPCSSVDSVDTSSKQ